MVGEGPPSYELQEDMLSAIQREKNIKDWPRAWKVRLIQGLNPEWLDLYNPFLLRRGHKVVDGGPSPAMMTCSAHAATPAAGGGTATPCAA